MNFRVFLIIFAVSFLLSCGLSKKDKEYTQIIKKTLEERMPYVFKQSIYLHKPKSVLFSGIVGISFSKNYIAALSREGFVHLWSANGAYITQVGVSGKSPGAYTTSPGPGGFAFTGDDQIIVVDRKRNIVNKYSIEPNGSVSFIDDFDLAKYNRVPADFIHVDSKYIYFYYPHGYKGSPLLVIADKMLKSARAFIPLDRNYFTGSMFRSFFVTEGKALLRAPFNSKELKYFSPLLYIVNTDGKFERKIDIGNDKVFSLDVSNKIIVADSLPTTGNTPGRSFYSLDTGKLLYTTTEPTHLFDSNNIKPKNSQLLGTTKIAGEEGRLYIYVENSLEEDCAAVLHIYELDLGIR